MGKRGNGHKKASAEDINEHWERVVVGLLKIFEFLHIECGLLKFSDLPYKSLMPPLFWCLICKPNKDLSEALTDRTILDKCKYWYWISIFAVDIRKIKMLYLRMTVRIYGTFYVIPSPLQRYLLIFFQEKKMVRRSWIMYLKYKLFR